MNLKITKILLYRKDLIIILIGALIRGTLQIIAHRYLKNHPERLLEVEKTNETPSSRSGYRGGALLKISGGTIKIFGNIVINYTAKKGLMTGLMLAGGKVAIDHIPLNTIVNIVWDASVQNLPELERTRYIIVKGEKIYLDQCDGNFRYLFKILKDDKIPFEEKEKITNSVLKKHLDLKTVKGRTKFVLCIVLLLYVFSIYNPSGYFVLVKNLIKAIKEGKISKAMARQEKTVLLTKS